MDSQSPKLPVVLRIPEPRLQIVPSGAGRLLSEVYLAGGRYLGKKFGQLAHHRGLGPDAVAKRIEQQLESREWWLLDVNDFCKAANGEVKKDCLKLMKYALSYASLSIMVEIFTPI